MKADMIEYFQSIIEDDTINVSTAIFKMIFSLILGTAIGTERQFRRRDAGIRTFTLICLGATAAMLISIWIPQSYPNFLNGDPGRIAAQVLTGIGFLGAGAIIQGHGSIHGLTTAACIWVIAVIGLAVGAGMYLMATIATALTLFILISVEQLEKRFLLDGVNKLLVISCSTSDPDLEAIRQILDKRKIFIISRSFEHNYDNHTTLLTYKVNVKSRAIYSDLFSEFLKLGYISEIKLTV
jgi:putative Mg2+ transporter-C (MgtC) family protein